MLKNYIKIALRNFWKQPVNSAISIGGLAIGLACCILLALFIRFEWSYDSFHENSDRIYRVVETSVQASTGDIMNSPVTPYPLAPALISSFPEIEGVSRMSKLQVQIHNGSRFVPQEVFLADSAFFKMFSFPLESGDPATALSSPDRMVLTRQAALRIFGSDQIVGELVTVRVGESERSLTVSAIAESPPENSGIKFEVILPFENYLNVQPDRRSTIEQNWWQGFGETWVMTSRNSSKTALEEKFPDFMATYVPAQLAQMDQMEMWLQPLNDIYFNEEIRFTSVTERGNTTYLWVLTGITLVIFLIAGMNFMSLTLSRSSARNNEIGIRKVFGAQRVQLGQQYIGEVFITCGVALFLAVLLAQLIRPLFQYIVQKPVDLIILSDSGSWLILGLVLLFVTVITGGYPAFVVSRRKVTGLFAIRWSSERIPAFVKGLIVAQFALSIVFLVMTFVMQGQLQHMFNRDLGYAPEHVITVEFGEMAGSELGSDMADRYLEEIRYMPGVESASVNNARFYDPYGGIAPISSGTSLGGIDDGSISFIASDEHYIETMGLRLTEGVNFSRDIPSGIQNGMIVNTRFAEQMGWESGEAVGHVISEDGPYGFFTDSRTVIGVVDDFHYRSLHYDLEPIIIIHRDSNSWYSTSSLLVRIEETSTSQTIARLTSLWDEMFPGESIIWSFMDDRVRHLYEEEQRWSRILLTASLVAIILTCLGLLGVASLETQRRTREIGIRKVLGATVTNIVALLNKDFLKLVLTGFILATPIAWYAMNRWLEEFAYRIEIGPGVFLLAGSAAILIALATVSWQSVRAALANPVNSLRSE